VRTTEQAKENYAASIISNHRTTYWLIPIDSPFPITDVPDIEPQQRIKTRYSS